jgi:hypothetical protein
MSADTGRRLAAPDTLEVQIVIELRFAEGSPIGGTEE